VQFSRGIPGPTEDEELPGQPEIGASTRGEGSIPFTSTDSTHCFTPTPMYLGLFNAKCPRFGRIIYW
jgi:hypothetical protein